MLAVTLQRTSIPSREQSLHATETGISSSLMSHSACIRTFAFFLLATSVKYMESLVLVLFLISADYRTGVEKWPQESLSDVRWGFYWEPWNLANILRYIIESQISPSSCNNMEQQPYHWDTKFANAGENLSSGKHGGFLNRIRQNKQTIKPMQLQSLISESCQGLGQTVHVSHTNLCKILRFCGAILKTTFNLAISQRLRRSFQRVNGFSLKS